MNMKKLNSKVQFSISDTPLPHNFIAEKIILSCLLINYEAIEVTIKTVRVETFYFINHQEIYKAIVEMYRKKLPVNVFSVNDFSLLSVNTAVFSNPSEKPSCGGGIITGNPAAIDSITGIGKLSTLVLYANANIFADL